MQHDSTIHAFMNNLGAPQPENPNYAAAVMLELHKVKDDYFVEVRY
jgi:hypothetical protein